MPALLRILAILLLKAGPQHLPYSLSLFATLTLLYLASGVLVLTTSMSMGQAAANMVLDVAVLFSFSYFCLSLLKYKARFVQMVSALAGIGIAYHLLAWPLFVQIHNMQPHAMQMSMMRALALSFGYLFLSMAAAEAILPGS